MSSRKSVDFLSTWLLDATPLPGTICDLIGSFFIVGPKSYLTIEQDWLECVFTATITESPQEKVEVFRAQISKHWNVLFPRTNQGIFALSGAIIRYRGYDGGNPNTDVGYFFYPWKLRVSRAIVHTGEENGHEFRRWIQDVKRKT